MPGGDGAAITDLPGVTTSMTHSTPPAPDAPRPSRSRARRITGMAVVAGLGVATVGVATFGQTATAAPANILQKLEMRDRTQLTRYAIRTGLLEP